jgi:hypothetical protein
MAMMWGGFIFMFLFPLLMLGLLALVFIVAAGGMGWIRGVSAQAPTVQPVYPAPLFSSKTCPACHRPVQADWQVCPYDGTKLD